MEKFELSPLLEARLLNAIIRNEGFSTIDFINGVDKEEGYLIKLFAMMCKKELFTRIIGTDSGERIVITYFYEFNSKRIVAITKTDKEQTLNVLGNKFDAIDVEIAILKN